MKALTFVLCVLMPVAARADLKIVTTTTDFADIAKQIGGAHVTVHSVMKGPENVHNVIAKPTEMVSLNQADLFVHSGVDAEPWRSNLMIGARNPRILDNRPGNVDMSNGVALKEVPTNGKGDRSQGDMHAFGNPHYTLNPQIAQRMAATLAKAMIAADPANADTYKQNAVKFVNEMGDLSHELKDRFAPYAGVKVITFHKAWEYFADAVPIDIVDTIEPQVGITPSPAQVKKVIDLAKSQNVKVIICETYDDSKLAQSVADQTGAKMIVLPDHVLGVPEADSYQKLFRYDVDKLIETAKAAGVNPNLPAEAAMLIEVASALFGYQKRTVVQVEHLALHTGRCMGIFGPNGVGKTTLVRGMTGLLPPIAGTVSRGQPESVRFGYLPQHRAMELHWPMTGFDAAAMALSALRPLGCIRSREAQRVRDAMARMDVLPLARHPFSKLSGGQQQRLLLAGALAAEPTVLVLDEPTDGLDVRSRRILLDVLHEQNRRGLCTVMISHDVEDLLYIADQIAWLHPPDDPDDPSRVEVIAPAGLAQRVAHVQHAS